MASTTRNSNEVQVVFGTDATLATKVSGAAFDARDNSALQQLNQQTELLM